MLRKLKKEITAFLVCFAIGAVSCSYNNFCLPANAQDPEKYETSEQNVEEYKQLLLYVYDHAKKMAENFALSGNEEYSIKCLEKAGEASREYHELSQK